MNIRFNLELARSKTVDKVIPSSKMFFVTWTQSLINTMSEKAWAHTGIIMFILMILALSLFIFGKRVVLKKVRIYFSNLFLSSDHLANIFAQNKNLN